MPASVTEYRCLLISPSDVTPEREAATAAVTRWNAHIGRAMGIRIELVAWETHSVPALGAHPQQILNTQIVDECDLAIAIFWVRAGTATPTHSSGSAEEIERLHAGGRPVMVYFKSADVPQSALRDDQYTRLQMFRSKVQNAGLVGEFSSSQHLETLVLAHLTASVRTLTPTPVLTTPKAPPMGWLTSPEDAGRVRRYVLGSLLDVLMATADAEGDWYNPSVWGSVPAYPYGWDAIVREAQWLDEHGLIKCEVKPPGTLSGKLTGVGRDFVETHGVRVDVADRVRGGKRYIFAIRRGSGEQLVTAGEILKIEARLRWFRPPGGRDESFDRSELVDCEPYSTNESPVARMAGWHRAGFEVADYCFSSWLGQFEAFGIQRRR